MIFEKGDEHSGRSDYRIVEGVRKFVFARSLVFEAYAQPARLRVGKVGAAAYFEIFLLAGAPRLYVEASVFEVCQIAGTAHERAHRYSHRHEEFNGVRPQFFVPIVALFGLADYYHLLLFKLVYAVNAALLYAVGALFFAEAGRIGSQRQRKLLFVEHGVHKSANHRMFRRADEVQVFALYLIHHSVHLFKAHNARNDVAPYHKRGNYVGEALVYHKVAGICQYCRMKASYVADEVVKAVARGAAGAV